jgi:hypothetical protein
MRLPTAAEEMERDCLLRGLHYSSVANRFFLRSVLATLPFYGVGI